MTFSLSLPVKIALLAGTVLILGAAGVLLVVRGHPATHGATVVVHTTKPHHVVRPQPHVRPAVHQAAPAAPPLDPTLPIPLRNALRHSASVVAVLVAPGDPADVEVLAEARKGAASAHAHLVILNVNKDLTAGATATWMHNVVEPAILVVKRPGTIAVELDGYADRSMVEQAIVDSRR